VVTAFPPLSDLKTRGGPSPAKPRKRGSDRRRLRIILRHGAKKCPLGVRRLNIGDRLLAAGIESCVGNVHARRGRAFDHIKGDLNIRVHRRLGERLLRRLPVGGHLEEGEHVSVVEH
jgi:hypothetical protein